MSFVQAQRIQQSSSQITKSEGCIKAVSPTILYYMGWQSVSIITKHEMNLKRPIFCQIIKSLSFMSQSQWKLPSLCSCPDVEKKKRTGARKQRDDNGAWTSSWLQWDQCSCASLGFRRDMDALPYLNLTGCKLNLVSSLLWKKKNEKNLQHFEAISAKSYQESI